MESGLEVESEAYFYSELGTVVIDIPVSGRFDSHRAAKEESIAGFQPERELSIVINTPVPTVQVDIGTQVYAYLIEIIAAAYTPRINVHIGTAIIPGSTGIHQQSNIVYQESTAFGLEAETGFVRSGVVRQVQTGDRRIQNPFTFFKLSLSRHCDNEQANE